MATGEKKACSAISAEVLPNEGPLLFEFGEVEKENIPITATLVLFHPPSKLWAKAGWPTDRQAKQQTCI